MHANEQWRSPPGYEGRFEVSDLGRVRRLFATRNGKPGVMALTPNGNGYFVVGLSDASGKRRNWLVHRLVLTAFVGPRPQTIHGAHLDGSKANNALTNLRWCTASENEGHKRLHGRTVEGEKNGCARLTASTVAQIRSQYLPRSQNFGLAPLGRRYGISFQHVSDIIRGKRWKHVTTN